MADKEPELPHVNMPKRPEPVTQVDIPRDGGIDASLQPTDETPAEAVPEASEEGKEPGKEGAQAEPDRPKPVKKSPFQARIDALTARERAAERKAAEAEAQAQMYKAMAEGKAEGKLAPTQAELDALVNQRAQQIEAQKASQKVFSKGNTEYPDFTERCNIVANLGAGDRPDFMQVIADPDIIPDGHKVIALLAENPEVAQQIVDPNLTTAQMSARLVKFAMDHSKPPSRPISSAPAPIKGIDGRVTAPEDINNPNIPMAKYAEMFMKKRAERFQRK